MIKSPAKFPFPGSYALHEADGQTQLVRILSRDFGGVAVIAYPLRLGASGNSQVPVAALLDATPLDAAEQAELDRLETLLAGAARPKKADLAREQALRLRDVRSLVLREKIAEGIRRKLIQPDAGALALSAAA